MKTATLLLLLLLASLPVSRAMACSCVPPGPPAEEAAQADAIFHGEVTGVRDSQPPDTWWTRMLWRLGWGPDPTTFDSMREVRYTFRVLEAFKGVQGRSVQVSSRAESASCGVGFEQGRRYVVYARQAEGRLSAGLCSLTGPAEDPRRGLHWLRANRGRIAAASSGMATAPPTPCAQG